jgi:hypothetical protein
VPGSNRTHAPGTGAERDPGGQAAELDVVLDELDDDEPAEDVPDEDEPEPEPEPDEPDVAVDDFDDDEAGELLDDEPRLSLR